MSSSTFILIHPPISKPCEPPAGLAYLAGALRSNKISCKIIDLNIEGIYHIINTKPPEIKDTWTKRAIKNINKNINQLRINDIYKYPASYINAVKNINRVLENFTKDSTVRISLANYHDSSLSPTQSKNLLHAMTYPEKNPFFEHWNKRLDKILKSNICGIGISINYLSQAICGFSIIGLIRKFRPDIKVWVGGGLISSWINRFEQLKIFQIPELIFISGPGEKPLLEFFDTKEYKYYSCPDYDDVYYNKYMSPGFVLPYSASRGCYWRKCAFCPERAEEISYLPSPKDMVTKHIDYLIKRYKPSLIHFLDNALSPKILKQLIKYPPKIPWYGFARITKHLTNLNFCMSLKRSGCIMLKLGIESADNDVLNQMNKGLDLTIIQQALETIHKAGIRTYVYFLFGTPYENIKSYEKTKNFICNNNKNIDFLNLAIFNLPINSLETKQLKTKIFYDGDLSLYLNFEHPFDLDRSIIRNYLQKEIKSHPDISPIIKRNPISFTSNHAPFIHI